MLKWIRFIGYIYYDCSHLETRSLKTIKNRNRVILVSLVGSFPEMLNFKKNTFYSKAIES